MSRENGFMIIIEDAKNKATQQLALSSKKVVIGLIMIVLCVDVANCESLMNLPTTFLLFFASSSNTAKTLTGRET